MREPRPCARQTQGEEQLPEQREGRHRFRLGFGLGFGLRHFNSDVRGLTCRRAILAGDIHVDPRHARAFFEKL